jgi:hypothetical protein
LKLLPSGDYYIAPKYFADYTVALLNGADPWQLFPLSAFAGEYKASEKQFSSAEMTRYLRALVDNWIDSGKDASGIEEPSHRNVSGVFQDSGERLTDVLGSWIGRHRPMLGILGSGELAVWDPPIPTLRGSEPAFFGKEFAVYWLYKLLNSLFASRLARCGNQKCGRYYLRRRVRKSAIKRGAFCSNCSGAGSAARTKISRKKQEQELIEAGAYAWPSWRADLHGKQSEWVALEINTRLGKERITGNWVTRNRPAIEAEVKRRMKAKD